MLAERLSHPQMLLYQRFQYKLGVRKGIAVRSTLYCVIAERLSVRQMIVGPILAYA